MKIISMSTFLIIFWSFFLQAAGWQPSMVYCKKVNELEAELIAKGFSAEEIDTPMLMSHFMSPLEVSFNEQGNGYKRFEYRENFIFIGIVPRYFASYYSEPFDEKPMSLIGQPFPLKISGKSCALCVKIDSSILPEHVENYEAELAAQAEEAIRLEIKQRKIEDLERQKAIEAELKRKRPGISRLLGSRFKPLGGKNGTESSSLPPPLLGEFSL